MNILSTIAITLLAFAILIIGSTDAVAQDREVSDADPDSPRIVVDAAADREDPDSPRIVVDGETPDDADSEAPDDADSESPDRDD